MLKMQKQSCRDCLGINGCHDSRFFNKVVGHHYGCFPGTFSRFFGAAMQNTYEQLVFTQGHFTGLSETFIKNILEHLVITPSKILRQSNLIIVLHFQFSRKLKSVSRRVTVELRSSVAFYLKKL